MAPFKVKCYLQLIQCCQNKWMSKLEMTCFSGASRVTLSANFPHPVPCFCLLFVPATQLQRSVQPVWLSFMWLQLSCHGNSVSPMRQGFSAGKHFRLDARWPVSARRMGGGDTADKAGRCATHWSVGLDTPLPPGWHHRLQCRPRCPVPWCLLALPVSKNKFSVLKTKLFSCFTAVKSNKTTCTEMKELHRKAAALITPHDRRRKSDGGRCPSTSAAHKIHFLLAKCEWEHFPSSKGRLWTPSTLPFDRIPTHTHCQRKDNHAKMVTEWTESRRVDADLLGRMMLDGC